MNIFPYLATGSPLLISSASDIIRFMQLSHFSRIPMYSWPLFNFTSTLLFIARLRSFKGSLRNFAPHNPCYRPLTLLDAIYSFCFCFFLNKFLEREVYILVFALEIEIEVNDSISKWLGEHGFLTN